MIEVKYLRDLKLQNPWDVKVDGLLILGNPFPLKSEYEREKVCEDYKNYFNNIIARITGDMLSIDYGVSAPFAFD
jgi:hypothetical protein